MEDDALLYYFPERFLRANHATSHEALFRRETGGSGHRFLPKW